VKDNDVLVSQHFFSLKLTKDDVVVVLKGLQNAILYDPAPIELGSNSLGNRKHSKDLLRSLRGYLWLSVSYHEHMLRYHIAFFLPHAPGGMVVAEALDFPGAISQGFDLPEARLIIASAMEDLAQLLLEEGKPLPTPTADAAPSDADLIELVPLSVHVGAHRV